MDKERQDELIALGYFDPVIQAYKKDVDRSLLRENLKLTPDERLHKFEQFIRFASEIQRAGKASRTESS